MKGFRPKIKWDQWKKGLARKQGKNIYQVPEEWSWISVVTEIEKS